MLTRPGACAEDPVIHQSELSLPAAAIAVAADLAAASVSLEAAAGVSALLQLCELLPAAAFVLPVLSSAAPPEAAAGAAMLAPANWAKCKWDMSQLALTPMHHPRARLTGRC